MVNAAMLTPKPRSRALALFWAALGCLAVLAACSDPEEALLSDDECLAAGGGEGCTLNQLQRRTAARRGTPAGQAAGPCSEPWAQCGGQNHQGVAWAGQSCCVAGYDCVEESQWYSQCRPRKAPTTETTSTSTSTSTSTQTMRMGCLCTFDIDRTLTVKQGEGSQCPGSRTFPGVLDLAYSDGDLTLNALGAAGLAGTFCEHCYLGIISAGNASGRGSQEQMILAQYFLSTSVTFRDFVTSLGLLVTDLDWPQRPGGITADTPITSPLVLFQPDGKKQVALEAIVKWYNYMQIGFLPKDVYFFDDRVSNIAPFANTGFNARQISCTSRDGLANGAIGFCGGTPAEIVEEAGVKTCEQQGIDPQEHLVYPLSTTTTTSSMGVVAPSTVAVAPSTVAKTLAAAPA